MHEDLKLLHEAITALRLDILDSIQFTQEQKKMLEAGSSVPDYFSDGKIQAYQEILQTLDRSGLTKIK